MESENGEFRRKKDESFRDNFRGTRVFVQGLPDWVNWQEVKDHFKKAGDVVFASVSIDTQTGQSKNCGVVQYETTDMARNAIKTMRDHPLDGNILYVRPDYQEDAPTTNGNGATTPTDERRPSSSSSASRTSRTLASTWHCADEDNASHLPPSEYAQITTLIQSRDKARRSRDYDTSDTIRDDLKRLHRVHLDDRLKSWWYAVDDVVPSSIRNIKGEGKWGKRAEPERWRQITTTIENDACVSADLVNGLLTQRDIARKEKDFKTADALLEEAKYAPEGADGMGGELTLLIHDADRTWRIWTAERPRRMAGAGRGEEENVGMTGAEKCIALVMKHEPEKVDEVKGMLQRFPGREYSILKRLKENYFQ